MIEWTLWYSWVNRKGKNNLIYLVYIKISYPVNSNISVILGLSMLLFQGPKGHNYFRVILNTTYGTFQKFLPNSTQLHIFIEAFLLGVLSMWDCDIWTKFVCISPKLPKMMIFICWVQLYICSYVFKRVKIVLSTF